MGKMFTQDSINEGIIQRPKAVEVSQEKVKHIISDAGIKSPVFSIGEPNIWVMQSQRVYLEDGRYLLLKIGINQEWTDASSILNQVKACELLRSLGISQPKILAYSVNNDDYGFLYLLSEGQTGVRLCDIYVKSTEQERTSLYGAIGQAYSKVHSLKNNWAGIWDGDVSKNKYSIHPSDFYRNAEIFNGSAKYLFDNKVINESLFENICLIWDKNLTYMKSRHNTLVHISPFPWSIYISRIKDKFKVTGFSALGDFMWWDPMVDAAHLLYPPYMRIKQRERQAFIKEYGMPLDKHAINLYMLLNRLCAMSGCYFAPVTNTFANEWIRDEVKILQRLVNELLKWN